MTTPEELLRQKEREAAQRQAAMGRRVAAIQEGHLGGVLKRWINADVVPIADLVREVARAYLADDMAEVGRLLDMPTVELDVGGRVRPLRPLMEWCLRGSSPGRSTTGQSTYADDIVLSFLATAISVVAQSHTSRKALAGKVKGPTFSAVMASTSDSVRQTVLGQFITGVQGAAAMQAIRERRPELWKQKKSLSRICSLLQSQARPLLRQMEEEGVSSVLNGHKTVLKVIGASGHERMLTVRPPDRLAWEVMTLCWQDEKSGATSEYRSHWLGFTALLLAAAQRVSGWFDLGANRTGRKGHTRTTKHLLLSSAAVEAITKDTERWLTQGFDPEPMVVPPEGGDYLTVKHRPVTGQRPPRGLITKARGTSSWEQGAVALASTPWTVNAAGLESAQRWLEGEAEPDANSIMRVASHARLASEPAFYLPTCMDFRGRIYYRTPWVSPQSGDLGKSLLAFPLEGEAGEGKLLDQAEWADQQRALAMHLAGLYAGPAKLDKAPLVDRQAWFFEVISQVETHGLDAVVADLLPTADKPRTLAANLRLAFTGQSDRIPIQLDGTCNGLQHLSALFRDEEAAKHVNLVRSSLEEPPADIYGVVAGIVNEAITRYANREHHPHYPELPPAWVTRFEMVNLNINRKVCKGPVMVLPYGGTREAVRLSVKSAVLDQLGDMALGTDNGGQSASPWHRMERLGYGKDDVEYGAFRGRDLYDHPGFGADIGQLANLIWESITPAIPRAMAAMGALVAIAGYVGDRGLSWRVGLGPEEQRLWVTQAKAKSSRKQVTMRGFHLPDMVRRLTLMANTNEVDEKGHRTGIVANFIHSLDAAHLAATVALFRREGGQCVGSVHDCLLVRPSEAALMGRCLRDTFVELYEEDPLSQPVRLIGVDGVGDEEYPSWYALAEVADRAAQDAWNGKGDCPRVSFPERGSFDIREVRESAWFFS